MQRTVLFALFASFATPAAAQMNLSEDDIRIFQCDTNSGYRSIALHRITGDHWRVLDVDRPSSRLHDISAKKYDDDVFILRGESITGRLNSNGYTLLGADTMIEGKCMRIDQAVYETLQYLADEDTISRITVGPLETDYAPQQEVEALEKLTSKLQEQLDDLNAVLETARDREAAAQTRIEDLQSDINALLGRMASEAQRAAQAESEIKRLKEELSEAREN